MSVPGGVQEQVVGLARALRLLAHDVQIIAPDVADGAGVSVGRSLGIRVNGSVAPVAPLPSAAARAARALRRGRFDVVHVHEPLAPSITIPAVLTRAAPLVATFHPAGERTPYRWWARPGRWVAARIDVRVAVSPLAAQLAQRYLGGDYDVLFNAIEPERFLDGHQARASRPTVLFVGRHEERKGLAVLLAAVAALPDDVAVWVAGSGPLTTELQRRWAHDGRIVWLGPLDDDQKVARLRAASVVCAPSLRGESFGLVLLEAMAAGTPLVASDLPAYRAVAGPHGAAELVPPGDPVALAAALRRVLGDAPLATALRDRGRRCVAQYSMIELARCYEALYRRAIRSAPGARRGAYLR